jgi:hypothetical protein
MSRRPTGRADSAAERMRRWRKRQRARGLKPVVSWVARPRAARPPSLERRLHEARTLALCAMAADKIERAPELLDVVHRNFERWELRERVTTGRSIRLWRKVLRLPWPRIAELLTEQSKAGLELRAITPLFGVLTARERRRISRAFQPSRAWSSKAP